MFQNVLSGAAIDGARTAALRGQTTNDVEDAVEARLVSGGIDPDLVTITVSPSSLNDLSRGDPVTISLSVPASELTWVGMSSLGITFNLTSEMTYRRE